MKKFITITACTLGLTLMGTIGSYQNSLNLDNLLNTKTNSTNVVEDVTNRKNQTSLISDDQMKVTDNVTKVTNMDTKSLTPEYTEESKTESKVLGATVTKTTNVRKLIYKNVDLSKCKSVNDVVKVLRKNGYTKITKKNIYKNKSLRQMLAIIKAKPTTTPTKAPVATTKPTATPTPTKAPVVTTKPSTGVSNYASEVLRLVNEERAKEGLAALTTNTPLINAANKRAEETVKSFSHTRPNGTNFSTALAEYGVDYRTAGENIAYGQKTPQEVVTAWMNSPGHRANIMNSKFNKIGIGVHQSNGVIYWSQLFTN